MIPSFKNYNLSKNPEKTKRASKLREKRLKTYSIDLLLSQFKPDSSMADNIILYNITGKKMFGEKVDFSSSTENDDDYCGYEDDFSNDGTKK